ncbi:MAG: hypothetical protein ACP5FL_08305, partial [Thermoplasmatota archaeon]
MEKKKKTRIVFALMVVVLLVITVLSAYFTLDTPEKKEAEKEKHTVPLTHLVTKTYEELKKEGLLDHVEVVDDRISPYGNQAVHVDILRIRNRDLLDRMLTVGTSWREKPRFYHVLEVDGKVSHGKGNLGEDELYETWDTWGKECMTTFDVEEDQETSEVTITIVEEVRTGLVGLRSAEVEQESFSVSYCYRTGRWSGHDYFMDEDGYGYFLGEHYEIWFNIYQNDYDNDGMTYWTEVNILGTDPTVDDRSLDPDMDSVPTAWEWKWGYDPFMWNDHATLDPDIDGLTNT